MRCLSCHYNLKNLPEHRCPECGRGFDPDDPSTFKTRPLRGPFHARRVTILGLCTLTTVAICLAFYHYKPTDLGSIMAGLIFWPVLILGVLATYHIASFVWITFRRTRSK